jgi:hypothetical protein
VQDRDGAGELLRMARRSFPFIERIFADAGYQGQALAHESVLLGSALRVRKGGIGAKRRPNADAEQAPHCVLTVLAPPRELDECLAEHTVNLRAPSSSW